MLLGKPDVPKLFAEKQYRMETELGRRPQADAKHPKDAEFLLPEILEWVHFDFDKDKIKPQFREVLIRNVEPEFKIYP